MTLDYAEALCVIESMDESLAVLNQVDPESLRDHKIASHHAELLFRLGCPKKHSFLFKGL